MRLLRGAALCVAGLAAVACGSSSGTATTSTITTAAPPATTPTAARPAAPAKPPPPAHPQILPAALHSGPTPLTPAVSWRGANVAWLSRSPSGTTTLIFSQRLLGLHLHSGTVDAGTLGWRYGPSVGGFELGRLVAAFNGGFRLSTGAGGFASYGRVAVPLRSGLGSIVTYSDGSSDIGSWHQGVPAPGKRVVAVRQNLTLLIDGGRAAPTVDCVSCWGATLGGVTAPARSALGIQPNGHLVWVGGQSLTAADLANALLAVGVARAVELDINPEWVAAYFYVHPHGRAVPVAALPTQQGIPGQFLSPWSRDFFTIAAR